MKKRFFAVCLAALGLFALCACESGEAPPGQEQDKTVEQSSPKDEDKAEQTPPQNEPDEIMKAYAELRGVDAKDVSYTCYGEFDGTFVLMISCSDEGAAVVETSLTVDGIIFRFSSAWVFDVYREGEFYTLQKAFDWGFLTHDDLLTVRNDHRQQYPFLYTSPIDVGWHTQQEIIAAFIAEHADYKYELTKEMFSLRCFGAFDGVYVLFIDSTQWEYDTAIHVETVAGLEFVYGSGQKFNVYSDGNFYSLTNAYEKGILSYDELLNVYENY